jgi:hypothetical protein
LIEVNIPIADDDDAPVLTGVLEGIFSPELAAELDRLETEYVGSVVGRVAEYVNPVDPATDVEELNVG